MTVEYWGCGNPGAYCHCDHPRCGEKKAMEKHYFVMGGGMDLKACLKCGRPKDHDIHRGVSVPLKP